MSCLRQPLRELPVRMLARLAEVDSPPSGRDLNLRADLLQQGHMQARHVLNVDMAPDGVSLLHDAHSTRTDGVGNHGWKLDGVPVERPGALAVDGRRHDDVRGHTDRLAGLDDGDVGGTLVVGLA